MKLLILCFILLYNIAQTQNHDHIWLIGQQTTSSTVVNFSNSAIQVDSVVRNMPFHREAITMSDSVGNLLFYTNGINLNNNQYQLMQNGDGLNPGSIANTYQSYGYPSPNAMISIAHPIQNNKYYLFHQSISPASDAAGFGEYLYYTLIDMNANSGLGRVEKKNQILNSDSIGRGQLQMVKHGNGQDWWLIEHLAWSNGFHIFLVTGDTVIYAHKQHIGNVQSTAGAWTGQSAFSPDGSKYARYDVSNDLDIFDFDRCTGLFSNPIHLTIQDTFDIVPMASLAGIAISPSSQYLYVSSYHLMYQFDLWASNIIASKDTVGIFDGFVPAGFPSYPTTFSSLLLAPDNKIYGVCTNEKYLHVINNPDVGGDSCNVLQHSINLPFKNTLMFPNFPHYRTGALTGSACDTLTSITDRAAQQTNIKLYPNPATTSITLESEQPMQRIVVYNTLGQQVMNMPTKQQQLIELETSGLENGSYFISIWVGNEVVNKQFQILR